MQIQIYTNTYTGLWKQSFTSHTDYFCMAGKRLEHFKGLMTYKYGLFNLL